MKFKFTKTQNGGGYLNNKKITPKKSLVIGITLGIFVGGIGVGAATYFSASQISYTPSDSTWNVSNMQEATDSLYTDLKTGKKLIANAITEKGISTSSTASFDTMVTNIGKIASDLNLKFVSSDSYSDTNPTSATSQTLTKTGLTGDYMIVTHRSYTNPSDENTYPLELTTTSGSITQLGYYGANSNGGPRHVITFYVLDSASSATIKLTSKMKGYNIMTLGIFSIN